MIPMTTRAVSLSTGQTSASRVEQTSGLSRRTSIVHSAAAVAHKEQVAGKEMFCIQLRRGSNGRKVISCWGLVSHLIKQVWYFHQATVILLSTVASPFEIASTSRCPLDLDIL